jgi:hypothetical protein
VTSAAGTPAAVTSRSSESAPGRHTSPSANSSFTRSSSHSRLSVTLRQGWPMSSCRIAIEWAMLLPTICARAAADRLPP